MRATTTLVAVILAAGCGTKEAPPAGGVDKPDPEAMRKTLEGHEATVNKLLPEAFAPRLQFTAQVMPEGKLVGLVPKGWQPTTLPGTSRPPDGSDLGFMTRFSLDTNCDGTCAPGKDWAQVADKVDFAPMRGADFTVVKDEAVGSNGRLMIAKTIDRTYVVLARWEAKGSRYAVCRATLDQELTDAAPAFEAACREFQVVSWQ